MKIVFISNFINHHQVELCNFLYENSTLFTFIEMSSIPKAMLNFGYDDFSDLPYVTKYSENCDRIILEADAVICGADADKFIPLRMAENKLTFVYSERLWKKGVYRRFIPYTRKKVYEKFNAYIDKDLFVLCASCYLPYDLSLIGFPVSKCFKWGYFTKFEKLDVEQILKCKSETPLITWCARFITLKHLEDVLKAVKLLCKNGYKFKLNVIGSGALEKKYHNIVVKYKIDKNVEFKGSLSQALVREEMKKSQLFVFSSDFREGWGAVVNEAMNSLCVPIVSHAVGASAFLIDNGKNGYIYKNRNVLDLYDKIKFCLDNPQEIKTKAILAYKTIETSYNGQIAGERLIAFCERFFNGKMELEKDGPMSKTVVIKNNWIK